MSSHPVFSLHISTLSIYSQFYFINYIPSPLYHSTFFLHFIILLPVFFLTLVSFSTYSFYLHQLPSLSSLWHLYVFSIQLFPLFISTLSLLSISTCLIYFLHLFPIHSLSICLSPCHYLLSLSFFVYFLTPPSLSCFLNVISISYFISQLYHFTLSSSLFSRIVFSLLSQSLSLFSLTFCPLFTLSLYLITTFSLISLSFLVVSYLSTFSLYFYSWLFLHVFLLFLLVTLSCCFLFQLFHSTFFLIPLSTLTLISYLVSLCLNKYYLIY